MGKPGKAGGAAIAVAAAIACGTAAFAGPDVQYSEKREPCRHRNPHRNAYFGDLHVHTAYSFDAFSNGTRTLPEDAYRFARGEPIPLPPYDESGKPFATARIDRPLDFVAVTDHSETLGEILTCTDPSSPGYPAATCAQLRDPSLRSALALAPLIMSRKPVRNAEICGADGSRCAAAAKTRWREIQDAAERAYDRSASCSFTTFVGYEYTGTTDWSNLHRNVIFRNARVPDYAVSYVDAPEPHLLWERLSEQCTRGLEGCDVLAIPHNSNLSNGRMFPRIETGARSEDRQRAVLRNATEPVVEIFQHKANSECANGLAGVLGAPDELCEFEQVRQLGNEVELDLRPIEGEAPRTVVTEDCAGGTGTGGMFNGGCVSAFDFARGALLRGLEEERRLGVNPYRFGIIGSTDTHLSNPGDVREATWQGHLAYETALEARLGAGFMPSNRNGNPGGLAGVWAVENSRDAIFDALERREVFGTSGPRIVPRFFGGWNLPGDACDRADLVELGYRRGVPMGADLPARPEGAGAPTFIATAPRDPTESGAPLERLEVIKGWLSGDGRPAYRVFQVAGAKGRAHARLCATFTDPDFDAGLPAYYYLRAVEVPTKRWSTRQCEAERSGAPAVCAEIGTERIRELAWSSPIWYRPGEASEDSADN